MTSEIGLLGASIVLGVLQIILASHLQSLQRGYRWTASSREENGAPLIGAAGRAERALRNFLETFPLFAAGILATSIMHLHSALTLWGAWLYFGGRVAYAVLYLANFPVARSLVWNIPTIGILMIAAALFA